MDDYSFEDELSCVVSEIEPLVKEIAIDAAKTNCLSVTTLEEVTYHIRRTVSGYFIEKQVFEASNTDAPILEGKCYEDIHPFLDQASPLYRQKFFQRLSDKLNNLSPAPPLT